MEQLDSSVRTFQPAPARTWSRQDLQELFDLPFNDLLFKAQTVHREHFDANEIQLSTLLSIKTGGCPEDCAYCPQSAHYNTGLEREKLLPLEEILRNAKAAKAAGASRFCMGAAWRSPRDGDLTQVIDAVREVKALGLETCATLGMLTDEQASALAAAGLDYYNHNIDTSPEYYSDIITTRTFQERLDTLQSARDAGMKLCCGGILGMGETPDDRIGMLLTLANLPTPPESVPINLLIKIAGTPMAEVDDLDPIDFVKNIAVARILMPNSHVRLSAGRESMTDEMQALCFLAGANSIFYGDELLTAGNASVARDHALFGKLGLTRA